MKAESAVSVAGTQAGGNSWRLLPVAVWWQIGGLFIIALAVSLLAVALHRSLTVAELQRKATELAASSAHSLRGRLDHGLAATYAIAVMVRQGGGDFPQFEAVAADMLHVYRGVAALQLAPDGVIRRVVPLAGNESAVGFDLFKEDHPGNGAARVARETGKLTLAGPFNLVQGGLGMAGRLPIFVDDPATGQPKFWGFATALMRVDEFLKATAIDGLADHGYEYQLARLPAAGGASEVFAGAGAALKAPVHFDFSVPNGTWRLSLTPRDGWFSPLMLAAEVGLAVIFSLLVAGLAATWRRQPYVLQQGIDERTRDLSAANEALSQAEKEVRESAEHLRLVLTKAPIMLTMIDRDGRVVLAAGKGLEALGLSPAAATGDEVQARLAATPEIRRQIDRALGGESFSAIVQVGAVTFENWYSPVIDADGKVSGVTGVGMDISDRARAEGEQRKLVQAIEHSPVSIIITNRDGIIEYVNPKFVAVTGYTAAEVIGQTPRVLKSGDMSTEDYQKLWQTILGGKEWRGVLHNRRKDGELIWENVTISPIADASGAISHFVAVKEDITERKAIEDRMQFMAHHDTLTGLPNRVLLRDRFERALVQVERTGGEVAVCFLDLDRFKIINDTLGHEVGDSLLREVAQRLRSCVRETDTVSRLGGDEFVLVLNGVRDDRSVQEVAEKIQAQLLAPIDAAGQALNVTFSIGVSIFPTDGNDFESLLKRADTAMYHAKEAGRNTLRFFAEQMNVDAIERLSVTQDLRRAIDAGELRLEYQPQVDLADGRIFGVEALIRWQHPVRGLVPPMQFIPEAEESGLIVPIGAWALREACRQGQAWRAAGLPPLTMAVNISAIQFRRGDLEAGVAAALAESGFDPACLQLEITEAALLDNQAMVEEVLARLKAIGVTLAIDDFGAGYSSLSSLKRFGVDKLKIDQSFVHDIETDAEAAAIVSAVIQMAKSLQLRTIAEGVESEGMLSFLREAGCDEAQGAHFGPAGSADELLARFSRAPQP